MRGSIADAAGMVAKKPGNITRSRKDIFDHQSLYLMAEPLLVAIQSQLPMNSRPLEGYLST